MSDDHQSRGPEDPGSHDSPFPWMQGDLEEEITPPFRPWMIVVAAASMVIFIVAVWYAWSEGQNADSGPPPIIQADNSPVKMAPEEPGGMDVPHQESEVFDAIEDKPKEPVEELLPPPEEPVKRPEVVAENEAAPVAQAPAPAETKAAETPAPAKTEPAPPPPAPKPAAPAYSYVIQLAALQSEASARDAWAKLVKAHTRLLAPLTLDIEPVAVTGKGTFYRVRGAGFETQAEAEHRCADLKAEGQACLVKPR